MKKFYGIIVVVALVLSPFQSVFAKGGGHSWLFGADLSYLSSKVTAVTSGTTAESETNSTYYDLTLGYKLISNLLIGGIYSTRNSSDKGASLSTSTSASAAGISLGYLFDGGAHITGSYFLSATDDDYKKGSGMQIDIGWRSFVAGSFFLGAKLSYRSLKYTENETIPGFESVTQNRIMPYISLGFGF